MTRGALPQGASQEDFPSEKVRRAGELTYVADAQVVLGELVERWGEPAASALADGRLFVDGRRVLDPKELLRPGARVEIFAARSSAPSELRVLGRWGGIAAVEKPCGLATEPDHSGIANTVVALAARSFGVSRDAVHACSRLDVGVSGVVLLALDQAARQRVVAWREQGKLQRRYVALAVGAPSPARGVWQGAIGRARGSKRCVGGAQARPAKTRYATVAATPRGALLALEPVTGRTHQLRVHASHAGAPFYGDALYGGPRSLVRAGGSVEPIGRVALHAAWVRLPLEGGLRVEAEIPAELSGLWQALDGTTSDFALALADELPGA